MRHYPVEEQNEVESKSNEQSQEAEVVEVTRQVVLKEKDRTK